MSGISKLKKDEFYFDNINTEEKAYVLGFIAADGYVCHKPTGSHLTINVSNKDIEILNFIKKQLKFNGKLYNRWIGLKEYPTLRIFGKRLINPLLKLGFDENKTFRFNIPNIPENLTKHFIRGYFDGDGCIHFSKRKSGEYRYYIAFIGTDELCNSLNEYFVKNLGIEFRKEKTNSKNISTLRLERIIDIKKILFHLYNKSNCYLKRKYKKYRQLLKIHNNHNQETRKRLTTNQVKEIRIRIINGETTRSIAKDYPVSYGAIGGIKTKKSYSYIT